MKDLSTQYQTVEEITNSHQKEELQQLLDNADLNLFNVCKNPAKFSQKAMQAAQQKMRAGARPQMPNMRTPKGRELHNAAMNMSRQGMRRSYSQSHEEEPVTTTLPATRPQELLTNSLMNLEFFSLKDAPGQQMAVIKAIGDEIFGFFNNIGNESKENFDTGKAIVLSTLVGHEDREMNSMAHWIKTMGTPKHGFSDEPAEVDLSELFDNYKPKVAYYEVGNLDCKIVYEPENGPVGEGMYIYVWENGNRGRKLENKPEPSKPRRLKR